MSDGTFTASDVRVYTSGPVACSACYPIEMPLEDVTAAVNFHNPTGIGHGWEPSKDETFVTGSPNPTVCHDDPARMHRLFNC